MSESDFHLWRQELGDLSENAGFLLDAVHRPEVMPNPAALERNRSLEEEIRELRQDINEVIPQERYYARIHELNRLAKFALYMSGAGAGIVVYAHQLESSQVAYTASGVGAGMTLMGAFLGGYSIIRSTMLDRRYFRRKL